MIKVVLIDVDNTLLDFHKCAKHAMKNSAAELGIEYTEHMFETFIEINNGLWRRIEDKSLSKAELYQIRWNTIFEALGISGDGVAFEKLFRANLDKAAEKVDGAEELLSYLSSKYVVCAASNAAYNQQMLRLKNSGLLPYISHVFISDNIGHPKPSPEFFDAVFAELAPLGVDEAVMVGDSLTADIKGAIDYGIDTIWFDYTKEPVPTDMNISHIVYDLREIEKIL